MGNREFHIIYSTLREEVEWYKFQVKYSLKMKYNTLNILLIYSQMLTIYNSDVWYAVRSINNLLPNACPCVERKEKYVLTANPN